MLSLSVSLTAMAPGTATIVSGNAGTPPYTYEVVAGGAGGTIAPIGGGSVEARYTAPAVAPSNPRLQFVTIRVTDSLAATAEAQIMIGDALLLFCEIIQKEMNLANGKVYLYNQKIMQPTDDDLYIAVGFLNAKPFGNTNRPASTELGLDSEQSVNMQATLSLNIISRSTEALRRKEEVIMALASTYAIQQQERNGFKIGTLPPNSQFVNLSELDGAAIPYRFNISVNILYLVRKVKVVEYFDEFSEVEIETES